MQELLLQDPEVGSAVCHEIDRQVSKLELIASENFASVAVREAMATVLTHKYAEGYPGKRYYGGCEYVDMAEDLARDRAARLFGASYVNVQPHSGTQANMAVFFGALNPGDTFMGMDLSHGGHLSHGNPVNFSGRFYKPVFYGVRRETGTIDYDQVERLAQEHAPRLIIAGASAYPRIIDFARFSVIAKACGAKLMVDMAHIAGLVATGLHPSPIAYADFITSTTHKTLRGPRGGMILGSKEYGNMLNSQIFPGSQGGPLMHVIAAKAVAFGEALKPGFTVYQEQVVKNAATLAQALIDAGYDLVSGGTDNHLMLIDLTRKNITGKDAQDALDQAGITANKNTVPFDTRSPFVTSGVRIGTPALTTRGMKEPEMLKVAGWIVDVLANIDNSTRLKEICRAVETFAREYPLFAW